VPPSQKRFEAAPQSWRECSSSQRQFATARTKWPPIHPVRLHTIDGPPKGKIESPLSVSNISLRRRWMAIALSADVYSTPCRELNARASWAAVALP
jgi:hypothetical protein